MDPYDQDDDDCCTGACLDCTPADLIAEVESAFTTTGGADDDGR
jgi:hypothetical protein